MVATDGDVTPTTFSGWTIVGGSSVFAIDGNGQITVLDSSQLDREAASSFTLQITVSDGVNTSAAESVTINLTDVNDVVPVVTSGQSFNLVENTANGTAVGTVLATDGDVTPTTFSGWTIVGGSSVFAIDAAGQITVIDSAQLPTVSSFILTITVSDGVTDSVPETVTIYVTDINQAPFVVSPIPDVVANEDGPNLVIDLSTVFDDNDLEDTLTFSVVQITNATLVTVTIATSELTLDFLDDQNGLANVTIRATDSGALFVDHTFSVMVLSATQQIDYVTDAIQDLIDSSVLTPNQANPLTGKLDSATDKLNDGKTNAGINQLNAFINQVQAYINSGKLTLQQGEALIAAVQAAINSAYAGGGSTLLNEGTSGSSGDGAPIEHEHELLIGNIRRAADARDGYCHGRSGSTLD